MHNDRYLGVDIQTYLQILTKLRPSSTPPLQGELPRQGEAVFPLVESLLSRMGWIREGLKSRWISASRISLAFTTGTDRSKNSMLSAHAEYDGEYLSMSEHGLVLEEDRDLVTYVSSLGILTDYTMGAASDRGLLIYAPEALKSIPPSKSKSGSSSNGFHMFLDRRLIEPSLLAVFRPNGQPDISSC